MQRLIVILLAVLVAAAPSAGSLNAGCDCAPAADSSAAAAEGCCDAPARGDETPDPSERQDDRPCDGADCSVLCCTAVKTIGVAHDAAGSGPGAIATIFAIPDDTPRGAAHLDRLKRPPRA